MLVILKTPINTKAWAHWVSVGQIGWSVLPDFSQQLDRFFSPGCPTKDFRNVIFVELPWQATPGGAMKSFRFQNGKANNESASSTSQPPLSPGHSDFVQWELEHGLRHTLAAQPAGNRCASRTASEPLPERIWWVKRFWRLLCVRRIAATEKMVICERGQGGGQENQSVLKTLSSHFGSRPKMELGSPGFQIVCAERVPRSFILALIKLIFLSHYRRHGIRP